MSQYVDRNEAQKSYRPTAGSMSPGLKRAREPYRLKNALLGIALGAFAVGIWAYSISAVKQDVFDDVDDDVLGKGANSRKEGEPSTVTSPVAPTIAAVPVEKAPVAVPAPSVPVSAAPSVPSAPVIVSPVLAELASTRARGVIPALATRSGTVRRLLDPQGQTIVWGAPNVDQLGKIGDARAT